MAIGHTSAPLVIDNEIRDNLDGLVISEAARPTLRGNTIANNHRYGLVAISESQPNLGTKSAPGRNIFDDNGSSDIHNFTSDKLSAICNQINRDRIAGLVELESGSTTKKTASY